MQKSQFSGRLGAMRCDTARCRAIIITTDDIIPSVDPNGGGGGERRSRWQWRWRSKRIGSALMHF